MHYILWVISKLSGKNSLRNLAWQSVKNNYLELYKYRKNIYRYYFTLWLNSPLNPYYIIIPTIIGLAFFINIPLFSHLSFITIDYETAKNTLSNGIEYSGAIIGLSFVVIFFMMEVVKAKNHYTIREIFRNIKLNLVFSFSICVLLYFVVTSALSSTLNEDDVLNLATFGSLLMVILISLIAFMFSLLLRLFDNKSIESIIKKDFVQAARFYKLYELFVKESNKEYKNFMAKLSLTENDGFMFSFNTLFEETVETPNSIQLSRNAYLFDVNFYFLKYCIRKLQKIEDIDLSYNHLFQLSGNSSINLLYYDSKVSIPKFYHRLIILSFLTSKKNLLLGDYINKKNDLKKRLNSSIEKSDLNSLEEVLSLIRELKDITTPNLQ